MTQFDMKRRAFAEALGTALLVATVVGSGIMADKLANGNSALALLANTLATAAMLVVLIQIFAPISGAHFNPAVTLVFLLRREIETRPALFYLFAQISGGVIGTLLAHTMFDLPTWQFAAKSRTGAALWFSEGIASFGLMITILSCARWRPEQVALAVGLFIAAGYWFTASTAFANPAVTIARGFSDSFTGILPADIPAFVLAQLLGAGVAAMTFTWLTKMKQPPV